MNSQHAASAAKSEQPIAFRGQGGVVTVYRRIRALTYTYHPFKKVSILLEDRRFQQANIWASLSQIEAIGSCEECPETDKAKCGKCKFNERRQDNFTCRECSLCANYKNNCRDWNNGRRCSKYGSCMDCMNSGEYICCDICVHRKGSEDDDKSEDQGLYEEQTIT